MGTTIMIILIFVIATVAVLGFGFLGNKVSDGITNAVRSKKVQREQQNYHNQKSESLAARYNRMQAAQTQMPQRTQAPQLRFCAQCGQPLDARAVCCHACGTKVEQ